MIEYDNKKFKIDEHNVLTKYIGNDTNVTIPDGVTKISDGVFDNRTGLKSITIPNSVTTIGEESFSRCTSLKSITLPNSIKEINNQ